MKGQIPTKELLARVARNRLSTINEWEEYEFGAERRASEEVLEIHKSTSTRKMSPQNERQESRLQSTAARVNSPMSPSKFTSTAVLGMAYRDYCSESPLKGTPWEDAALGSVTHRRRHQRSAKEKEHIDFWLNLFG